MHFINTFKNFLFITIGLFFITHTSCESQKSKAFSKTKPTQTVAKAPAKPIFIVGDSYKGGVIFYVDSTKEHGLIATASVEFQGRWGCSMQTIGGTKTNIGSGSANTLTIVNACDSAKTAARVCSELELNSFSDWYLPSKEELNLLYKNKHLLRGIKTDYYWSSSEADGEKAHCQDFYDGHVMEYEKNRTYFVRPIRAF